jgi:hypothetical protein
VPKWFEVYPVVQLGRRILKVTAGVCTYLHSMSACCRKVFWTCSTPAGCIRCAANVGSIISCKETSIWFMPRSPTWSRNGRLCVCCPGMPLHPLQNTPGSSTNISSIVSVHATARSSLSSNMYAIFNRPIFVGGRRHVFSSIFSGERSGSRGEQGWVIRRTYL